jgi:hypothetical protein
MRLREVGKNKRRNIPSSDLKIEDLKNRMVGANGRYTFESVDKF